MGMEITKKFLESKGLSSKEIKEYQKHLKQVRKIVNENTDLEPSNENLFELHGGLRFFYQDWAPKTIKDQLPRCILFLFHAAYESSDLFYPLADYLKKHNILIVSFDYRGHGRTGGQAGGKLGDFHSISDIYDDAIALIREYYKKYHVPIFFLGYDIGALIAMQLTQKISDPIVEGLLLLSPIWKLEQKWKHSLIYPVLTVGTLFSKSDNHQKVQPELLETTYFDEYIEYSKQNPLRLKKMSYRMFKALLDLIRRTHKLKSRISIPCVFFQGTQDHIVDHYAVHRLYEKWNHPIKKIRLYENTSHNLLMDKYSTEIQEEILNFINNLINK